MAFLLNKSEHTVGDLRCLECWRGYPAKCVCGGYIHAQFVKEGWEGDLELVFGCDTCGENFKFKGVVPKKKDKFTRRRQFNKPR